MAPIHDACICGNVEEVKRILNTTGNPTTLLASTNEIGFNAYTLAFVNKQYGVIRHLTRVIPPLDLFKLLQDLLKTKKLDCSIHDVIENGFIEEFDETLICDAITDLLNEGKDVNTRNSSLDTPLHLACRYKMKLVINLLLRNGADVHSLSRTLRCPMHELCEVTGVEDPQLFEDILILLIEYGVELDSIDSQQQTPLDILHESSGYEHIKKVFTTVLIKTVGNLKQSLETTKNENNLTPQVQSLLIHASIAIKQLERLDTIMQT